MTIKRVVTSINVNCEDLVARLENRQALADNTIRSVQKNAAKASAQLSVVRYRLDKLNDREVELESSLGRWRLRAVEQSKVNQTKALQCVQALNKSQELLDKVRKQLHIEQQLARDLEIHLDNIENSLSELEARRDSLLARQAKSDLDLSKQAAAAEQSDAVFSQWEKSVPADEYSHSPFRPCEEKGSNEFASTEDKKELRQQLDDLCEKDSDNNLDGTSETDKH